MMEKIDEYTSKIYFDIVWKDEHIFEFEITAANGRFSGTTKVYDQFDSLLTFIDTLKDFPKNADPLQYEMGDQDGYSYFSMKFSTINTSGHIGVLVNMEGNVTLGHKEKLELTIYTEPNAIDNFVAQMRALVINQSGQAVLAGILLL